MKKSELLSLRWGDRLRLSDHGKKEFNDGRYKDGAIFLRDCGGGIIRLILSGQSTTTRWAFGFWDVANKKR